MKHVMLKTGIEEPGALVANVSLALQRALVDRPVAFLELVEKARDQNYTTFGVSGVYLESVALLEPSGSMHGSVRNILLASIEGNGMEMRLVSPVKKRSLTE